MASPAVVARPVLLRLLSASVSVAKRAGGIIRDISTRKDVGIVLKGGRADDPQTEADRTAERCIVASLKNQFPRAKIIGEENLGSADEDQSLIVTTQEETILQQQCPADLAEVKEEEVVVWVDPLDGTSEFTAGYWENVTVLIGIAVNGNATAGVIHQPFYGMSPDKPMPSDADGRTLWGLVGLGAFGFEYTAPPTGRRLVVSSRTHSTDIVAEAVQSAQPTDELRVGGAGCKLLKLLEGKADGYIFASPGTCKWDTCAGEAILRCVGGSVTDIAGNRYSYLSDVKHRNTMGVIAARNNHSYYVQHIPESVKEALRAKA